eukprot:gnl/TRDRNA2_/TRDRNA2_136529_c0_seq2.p1 gnl/TRDRNA2_/TRDRNA2_136529_c0~~gnl/TRDRNA2_/TRDRNA2_136529_c0_seq2.p1  ORF type:complete len:470 (+),score=56.05 gnl/TRDRNA2_/TRDRNA2_136529_c0_seq2:54-1463(+)
MQAPLLNCPHTAANAPGSPGSRGLPAPEPGAEAFWQQIFSNVMLGANAVGRGEYDTARATLADVLLTSTAGLSPDPRAGFACSLGVAAAFRLLALAYAADTRLARGSWAFRRAHQIALRFQHLAMVWITHVWEKFARREQGGSGFASYQVEYIDQSAWPISLEEINTEMTVVQNTLAEGGRAPGHRPRRPEVPHDFRDRDLRLGIVSLCAYPSDHVLPRYATSNHQIYADRHGYRYHAGREILDPSRPPAWGKIKLMYQALEDPSVDWWLWFDCDTYFMNMTVTLDSLLYKYAGAASAASPGLDGDIHMLVAEDHAMLNTGSFFLRSSEWSREFLRTVWGPDNSAWTDHPWWENASILWNFLKDNSQKFRTENLQQEPGIDDMDGIYPQEVRLMPQWEFNSYHPSTSRFLHDTWEPGKFAIAFNGVLSNTSPEVIRVLYGNYYELSCQLNEVLEQCVAVEDAMPWLTAA